MVELAGKTKMLCHCANFDKIPNVFKDLGCRTELHYIRKTPRGVEQCAPEMYPIVCPFEGAFCLTGLAFSARS